MNSGLVFFAGGESELWNGKAKLFQDKTVGGELALLTESEMELGFLWKSPRVLLFFWSRPHMHQIPHPGCEGKMLFLKVSIAGLSMKELVEAYWSSGQNVHVCSSHKPFLSFENLKGGVRALPTNSLGPETFPVLSLNISAFFTVLLICFFWNTTSNWSFFSSHNYISIIEREIPYYGQAGFRLTSFFF